MDEPINTFKTLDAVFDVSPTQLPILPVKEHFPVIQTDTQDFPASSDLVDDYTKARTSLRNLLDQGEHALTNMIQIAVQTESARGFEVVSSMIKTMSEVSKDLISLHEATNKAKKRSGADDKPQPQQVNNTQNNVVFQGSTSELFNIVGKK